VRVYKVLWTSAEERAEEDMKCSKKPELNVARILREMLHT
jgi:hypothetical protein